MDEKILIFNMVTQKDLKAFFYRFLSHLELCKM